MMSPPTVLHDAALPSARWLVWLLRFLNLGNHHLKGFGNIGVIACTRLDPAAVELTGQVLSLLGCEFPLALGHVAFVADNDDGNGLGALGTKVSVGMDMTGHRQAATHQMVQDLVADNGDHLEALGGGDAVDEQIAMQADKLAR